MKITERGLVLKEVKLRESDRILTLFTQNHGILSVFARGSLRPNNKLFSACGTFTYSEWTLHPGKNMYSATEAYPVEVFFGLRQSIDALALASYIAELLQIYRPVGAEAQRMLRLALNSYYVLSKKQQPANLVKAVFELRSAAESGFMPDLLACAECGAYQGGNFRFDIHDGSLLCKECAAKAGRTVNLNGAALSALRYVVLCEDSRLFHFTVGDAGLPPLCAVAEEYLLTHLDAIPKTLAFLRQALTPGETALQPEVCGV